jgi:hypothetical protein
MIFMAGIDRFREEQLNKTALAALIVPPMVSNFPEFMPFTQYIETPCSAPGDARNVTGSYRPSADPLTVGRLYARLKNFVSELDALLDVNPNSLEPLLGLLQKYFPLKHCDIQNAITIGSKSKYFRGAEESQTKYVFVFSNALSGPFSGFNVLFALVKASGDSEHPFAQVHMGK